MIFICDQLLISLCIPKSLPPSINSTISNTDNKFIINSFCSLLQKLFSYTKNYQMQFFTQIFQNKIDRFLSIDEGINPKHSPDSLIKALKSKDQYKYFKKRLNSKTTNIFKIFKRLAICSLLIIYSNKFYDLVEDIEVVLSGNTWIDKQFIQPYYMFLKKICASNQLYQNTKKLCPMPSGKNMQMLFYNIGLIKLLFKIVAKMPLLGRYYKSKNQQIVSNFINTIAVHAQKIYISFRQILGHMIENPKVHIPTKDDQKIMKAILRDQLPNINEQMKKVFLDKYFYPLGKGIGIKLFRPQQQPAESQKVIMGIISDHQNTNRQKQKSQLQITLFPQPGKVNIKFYEQTLMSHMRIGEDDEKNYEQEVADIDIDSQSEVDEAQISLQSKFKQIQIANLGKKLTENQIETGIQRYQQSVNEL